MTTLPTSHRAPLLALLALLAPHTPASGQSSCATASFPADLSPSALWGSFQPVTILQDSTNYTGNERSDRRPQATSVDVTGNWLAASFYHGIRIYDLTNPNAPAFLYGNNGYNGDWAAWPSGASEVDQWVYAAQWAPGDSTWLATGGQAPVGFAIWDTTSKTAPIPRYQDAGDLFVTQPFVARINSRVYAFAGSADATHVYDLTRTRELGLNRCVDRPDGVTRPCNGIHVTSFAGGHATSYLAGLTVGSRTFVVRTGSTDLQIWEVTTPTAPALRLTAYSGQNVLGVALWTAAGHNYLAALVPLRSGAASTWRDRLRIYDVTTCLSSACAALPAAATDLELPAHEEADFWKPLVALQSGSTPLLFFGHHDLCHDNAPSGVRHYEHYWDVSSPASPVEITSQTQIVDHEQLVDYWTWYYRSSTRGEAWTSPLDAAFYGSYLIRADRSLLDIHQWVPTPTPPVANFTWSPTAIYPADPVAFADASSGVVTARAWTFTGGSPATSTAQSPSVTWSTSGTRNVALTASNAAGSNTKTLAVTVLSPLPAISAVSITPSPALVGDLVTLQATASGRPPLTYAWTISGVAGSFTGNPVTWSTAGQAATTKTITLTVSNTSGQAIANRTLQISNGLVRSWSAVCPNDVCLFEVPVLVQFTTDVAGAVTQYEYDWDGNATWDETAPLALLGHVYNTAGSVTPRLRVSSGAASTTYIHPRAITLLPATSTITISGPSSLDVGQPGSYTATAAGCTPNATGWLWMTNGGTGASTTSAIQVSWPAAGTKALQAANSSCGSALGSRTVNVATPLFTDSFESGTTTAWSSRQP